MADDDRWRFAWKQLARRSVPKLRARPPMNDETPTPKLTGRWQVFATAARELAEKLQAAEHVASGRPDLAKLDAARASMLRTTRQVAEYYARVFARWTSTDVPIEQKHREQSEFLAFSNFVTEVLR